MAGYDFDRDRALEVVRAAGGVIERVGGGFIKTLIPDATSPRVREDDSIAYLDISTFGCLT